MRQANANFFLDIEGNATQRGQAHGEALRPVIRNAVSQWQEELAEAAKIPFETLLANFNAVTDYRHTIIQWAPHLLEEVHGIAAGAGLDCELIYAWQLVDEIIDFLIEHMYVEKCTLIGAYDQGAGSAPVVGKTQDLPHCYLGAHALIRTRYADSDIDIYNSTIAGILCQDGMNRNLAFCCNHIGQLARDRRGLPVTYVSRLLLEKSGNVEQGHELLREIPHASGMNYGLADKCETRTFEVSSDQVVEFTPAPNLKRVWHTNHPVANDNYCRDIALWDRLTDQEAALTGARFDFIEREVRKADRPMSVARIQELLSSREVPVSCHTEDDYPTINSVIMEMGENPVLLFAPGPPSQCDYIPFRFEGRALGKAV